MTFQCSVCNRYFGRRDHLARHETAHTNIRPFRCGICGRRFGRRDVLLRHASHIHHGGQAPCDDWVVVPARRRVHRKESTSRIESLPGASVLTDTTDAALGLMVGEESTASSPGSPEFTEDCIESSTTGNSFGMTNAEVEPTGSIIARDFASGLSRIAAFGESDMDDFLDRLVGVTSYSDVAQTLRHQAQSREGYGLLPQLTGRRQSGGAAYGSLPANIPHKEGVGLFDRRLSGGDRRRHSNVLPSFHDGLFSPKTTSTSLSPTELPPSVPHTSLPCLTQSIFNRLIQSYRRHSASIRPFLHFPTLDVSLHVLTGDGTGTSTTPHEQACIPLKRRPHRSLLLSIMALGAICDQKEALALELYHMTRKEILGWFADFQNRGSAREPPPLDIIQAFINYVSCGTKFGDKSIEDPIIGHTASLKSLVQEVGLEKPQLKPLACLQSSCTSCSTGTSHWLNWARHEERKRTFLTYFALVSSTLTYLDTVISMDWREVKHRMPCNDDAWSAQDPGEWKRVFDGAVPEPLFATEVKALFSGSGSDADADTEPSPTAIAATTAAVDVCLQTPRESRSRTDYSCFLLIAAVYWETWQRRLQNTVDFDATQRALRRWHTNWLRLTPQGESRRLIPLVGCSLAMFDNTQLLLHLDVKEAKEALVSREYGRFCVTMPALDLRLDSEGSGCSLLSGRDDWQQTYDIFFHADRRGVFRHVALYSVNALELTFKVHSESSESEKTRLSFSPHTGTAVFFCIQVLASWICFFSNCLNQGLYTGWVDGADCGEEHDDVALVGNILTFARNRRTQFNASFGIPGSPEALGGLSAGRLASDLLDLHSQIFVNCSTWPAFKHLGLALKARSARISEWLQPEDGLEG